MSGIKSRFLRHAYKAHAPGAVKCTKKIALNISWQRFIRHQGSEKVARNRKSPVFRKISIVPYTLYIIFIFTSMKISYNWLKQYVNTDLPAEEVGKLLTNCGLEVESIEKFETVKGGLEGMVIGEVKTKEKHPDADRLSVTTVDIGTGTLLNIVCGAANVAAGQKVVVATIGATLYPSTGEPFTIKKSKIRGALSEGMICAEDEIGLGTSHEGIMVLDASARIG